jgi:hypothetical protein
MMTWDERVEAVAAHTRGLTDRQAAFLVTVMLHAGVCVLRQYSTFAGMPHGRKVIDFFRLLVDRGYATAHSCRHNRARIFHIQYKPLYAAIGEPDNRHRKPTPLPRAVERLMVLDAVLADPTRTWLATEQDKLAHFMLTHRIPRHDLPSLIFRSQDTETVRSFPDKLPIGIGQYGEAYTFLYLVTRPGPVDFRAFLERHAELLRALQEWTIRLLIPSHYARATRMYREAFREHLAMPLRPTNLDDLRWYFHARRTCTPGSDERFDQAARAFSAPRFGVLYRAWLERGDPVLYATVSPVLADKIERGAGQLECQILSRQYLHLLPLVGTA